MLRQAIKKIPGARRTALFLGLATAQPTREFLLGLLPRASVGAEIGVHLGDFSATVLRVVQPKEYHLIDPWEHQKSERYKGSWYGGGAKGGQEEMDRRYQGVLRRFDGQIRANVVRVHRGYSTEVLEKFDDRHFDWIYIDGNHLYEYVAKDLEISFRKVKSGGYIVADDYPIDGQPLRDWWGDGVKRACDEFAKRDDVQVLAIRDRQFIALKR